MIGQHIINMHINISSVELCSVVKYYCIFQLIEHILNALTTQLTCTPNTI